MKCKFISIFLVLVYRLHNTVVLLFIVKTLCKIILSPLLFRMVYNTTFAPDLIKQFNHKTR